MSRRMGAVGVFGHRPSETEQLKRIQGLMLLVAVLTGLALAGLWWQSEQARDQLRAQALEQARQRSMNLADAMGGQVEGVLSSLDAALLGLRRDWQRSGNSPAFDRNVREILETLPKGLVDYVSVVDAGGTIVYNSFGAEAGVYVGDRPHFLAHRAGGDRLLVGKLVRSRLSGRWVFIVSRPLLSGSTFQGTVHLLVSSEYVAGRLAALDLARQDVVALIHHDGDLLAHSRYDAGAVTLKATADRPFMSDPLSSGGVFRYASPLDQHWRTAGWHRHMDTGLVTLVGLSEDTALAPLQPVLRREQNTNLVLTVLLLGGASLIIILLQRMGRSQVQLRELAAALEHRIDDRTRELAALNAELEAFAYTVSHDLRTPLRSIHGFASLLEDEEAAHLSQTGRTYLRRIQVATRRMGQLITDMLSMAHLSRSQLSVAPLDLSGMAQAIAEDLARSDPERQVQWEIEQGLKAVADPVLMRAVLQNLLGNAWKYTGHTPQARITFALESASGEQQTFCVSDNGAGFDMAYAQQLFQPFKRLHAHHEFEGSGVGLASVQRIIERHGGAVSGEGEVGRGACFRFSLPQRHTDQTADA